MILLAYVVEFSSKVFKKEYLLLKVCTYWSIDTLQYNNRAKVSVYTIQLGTVQVLHHHVFDFF